jgi:hypothetical protein
MEGTCRGKTTISGNVVSTANNHRRKKLGISNNTLTTATSLGGMVGMEALGIRPQVLGTIRLVHHTVTDVVVD